MKLIQKLFGGFQSVIFTVVGFASLYKSYDYLFQLNNIKYSVILFGVALVSFGYANLSKFKKFKGFGFEAELWEDKQKEAEQVINQLKTILHISSGQIIKISVKSAYMDNCVVWKDTWALFNKLEGELKAIDKNENLNDTKKFIYAYFYWAVMRALARLNGNLLDEPLKEHPAIQKPRFEAGTPTLLKYINECQELKNKHGINFDMQFIEKMQYLYNEREKGNYHVNDELIQLANTYD